MARNDPLPRKVLDSAGLREWLREQRPGRRFRRCSGNRCPIAAYLTRPGGPVAPRDVSVGNLSVIGSYEDGRRLHASLPRWAKKFTLRVDTADTKTITAAQALDILDRVAPSRRRAA